MGRYNFVLGLTAIFLFAAPSHGAVIPFDQPKQDTLLGIKINPTGPHLGRIAADLMEARAGEFGLSAPSTESRYYSATAKFKQPIDNVTMTIENISDDDYRNDFTLVAFKHGRRVARKSVELGLGGDQTQITVAAASIDKVRWVGDGWKLHPYIVIGMSVDNSSVPISPQVGGAAPEPGFIVIIAPILMFALLQRRRGESRARSKRAT